jgi:hypothetical protein
MNITDAQGLAFLRQQTTVLSSRAFNQEYDLVNWAELVPVNTDYPEWASGVDFQVGDLTGAAQWQSGYAKDVPLADVSLLSVSSQFAMYAVGYRYNVEEVGKALFAGYPLTARKAVSARQAADIFVAETALYGAGHPGWTGLLNLAGVTPALSPNTGTGSARNWVDANGVGLKTPEQIVAELNSLLMGPSAASGILASLIGDTILLPPLAYTYIATSERHDPSVVHGEQHLHDSHRSAGHDPRDACARRCGYHDQPRQCGRAGSRGRLSQLAGRSGTADADALQLPAGVSGRSSSVGRAGYRPRWAVDPDSRRRALSRWRNAGTVKTTWGAN